MNLSKILKRHIISYSNSESFSLFSVVCFLAVNHKFAFNTILCSIFQVTLVMQPA